MTTYVYNEHDENQVLTMRNKLKKKKRKRWDSKTALYQNNSYRTGYYDFMCNYLSCADLYYFELFLQNKERTVPRKPAVPSEVTEPGKLYQGFR